MKNKFSITQSLVLVTTFFLVVSCNNRIKSSFAQRSFDSTVTVHIDAIRKGKLVELDPTVADSVILISPFGERMHTKARFMKLHSNWFKQKHWEWDGMFVKKEKTDSMGYALVQYKYTQKDSVGNITFQNKNYLLLIFKNSANGWQLVHDQNTGIPN